MGSYYIDKYGDKASFIRVDITARVDQLNAAIDRVVQKTGRSLENIVHAASIIFARSAGKAMPPKGKWGHPKNSRERTIWTIGKGTFFGLMLHKKEEVRGVEDDGPFIYCMNFNKKKPSRGNRLDRFFWSKNDAESRKMILGRGIAKAQFWKALGDLGGGRPVKSYVGPAAERAARNLVTTKKGAGWLVPFIEISSDVATAEDARPYAEVKGLGDAKRQINSWANRLESEQKAVWK